MRALIVDDSRFVRGYLRGLLEEKGIECEEAADGQAAIDCIHVGEPFDLALVDWNMPVMNGLEFLIALRREFGPDNPPVVFCTTENDIDHIEQAITNGAQEFIMKPFDEEILVGKFAQVGLL